MNLESAIARVKELENIITQSAANHNALIGALQEANRFVCALSSTVDGVEKIVDTIIDHDDKTSADT